MFERTAIETSALSTASDVVAVASHFGFEHGRLAVALPRSWVRDVYGQLGAMPDGIAKATAIRALQRIKERALVGARVPFDPEMAWIDNAVHAQTLGTVEHIVVAEPGNPLFPILLTYLAELVPAHTALIPHTIAGFECACCRLVELSARVVLVDPYFDVTLQRNADVLRSLVKWGNEGKCTHFDIYCRASDVLGPRKDAVEQFERQARQLFSELSDGKRLSLRLYLLDDRISGRTPMHRRALITEQGGIAVDYGFQLEVDRKSEATVLAGEALEELRRAFYDGEHGYVCRHRVECSFSGAAAR